jgi:hypothetical protein
VGAAQFRITPPLVDYSRQLIELYLMLLLERMPDYRTLAITSFQFLGFLDCLWASADDVTGEPFALLLKKVVAGLFANLATFLVHTGNDFP